MFARGTATPPTRSNHPTIVPVNPGFLGNSPFSVSFERSFVPCDDFTIALCDDAHDVDLDRAIAELSKPVSRNPPSLSPCSDRADRVVVDMYNMHSSAMYIER